MKIEHIAIWADDIEVMRQFYITYFDVICGEKYFNPRSQYSSYFITFPDGGARIELMHRPDIVDTAAQRGSTKGLAHLSISVGEPKDVDRLTERLRADGYAVVGEPRTTGDGYYESVIKDPEGNYIELTGE